MMFGQTAAVYAFLRLSRALAAIAMNLFHLIVIEYFDDFSQIDAKVTSNSALRSMEGLLRLLGWKISMSETKRKPFDREFVSLGISIDLSSAVEGRIAVKLKPGRLESIRASVDKVLESGVIDFRSALSIRGKVVFAQGQLFARVAAVTCRLPSEAAKVGGRSCLSDPLRRSLTDLIEVLATSPPKVLQRKNTLPPLLVFTDGACEETTSVGAVLIDPAGSVEYFGAVLRDDLVDSWKSKQGQTQVIGQAELFPVLLAKLTWKETLRGRDVVFFLDNEAARLGLVKSYSPVESSLDIISSVIKSDALLGTRSWYARVPTKSNISDLPSRMKLIRQLLGFIPTLVQPVFPPDTAPARCLEDG